MRHLQRDALLRELADREAIRDVLHRYCRGVDRLDADIIRSVYHDDAFDDHGPFKGSRDEFIAWIVPFLRAEYVTSSHHMTTLNVRLEGDIAHVESYAIVVQDKIKDGGRVRSIAHARYVDRMECRNGDWRIARRLVVTDAASSAPLPPWSGTTPIEALGGGARDRSDPSYVLEQPR